MMKGQCAHAQKRGKSFAVPNDQHTVQESGFVFGNGCGKKTGQQLECKTCQIIYLTLTRDVAPSTPIHCSACGSYMGAWAEFEADFIASGENGVFEMHDGQIIRIE
ncbi:hypothetical protein LJR231_002612 [Phyllobacterium sp. LjRoot231]